LDVLAIFAFVGASIAFLVITARPFTPIDLEKE